MRKHFAGSLLAVLLLLSFSGCKGERKGVDKSATSVEDNASSSQPIEDIIRQMITEAAEKNGKLSDSVTLKGISALNYAYEKKEFKPFWSVDKTIKRQAQQLVSYIDSAHRQGLFKNDYHYGKIDFLFKKLIYDSLKKADDTQWAKFDVLLSNAFIFLAQDLKQGRLINDSAKLVFKNESFDFFFENIERFSTVSSPISVLDSIQPKHRGYWELKHAIAKFTDSMDRKTYTYLLYPFKDSLAFLQQLKKRLAESGITLAKGQQLDSAGLESLIKSYQKKKQLKQDGKISTSLVRTLNSTDQEKFKRLAVNLDRYKILPERLPERFIWVNLPAYHMKVFDSDTVALESKIICGKPETPTPLITSSITDLVLNPTWTVPNSIIIKEMLPGLKRNPGYLARRGLYLLNGKGEKIDPYKINWTKYSKGIPYRVQQGSGNNNALGVIKFNFTNKHDVYLHDTNARGLFSRGYRSLSHGCVRVQEWKKLAFYIARNDSMRLAVTDTLRYTTDSLKNWLNAGSYRKVLVNNKLPLFIRYFTAESHNGKLKMYEDIYGDDRELRERYFSMK